MLALMLAVLPWLATGLSVWGIVLNARRRITCWPVWLASNVLWFTVACGRGEPADLLLWSMFAAFNVYGWRQWKRT